MKPIIIVPPDAMPEESIKLLRENDICVVVANDPAAVKFVDPIPAVTSRSEIEHAAIQLSRKLLSGYGYDGGGLVGRGTVSRMFVELLAEGTPLDPNPTKAEVEHKIYESAKADEIRKIAREEARAEAAQRKAEKAKTKEAAKSKAPA